MTPEQDLHRIVEAAHRNPAVAAMIRQYVKPALLKLGWTEEDADYFITFSLISVDYRRLEDWEGTLQVTMPMPATTNLAACMSERADLTYGKIKPHLLDGSVLDLGGGSGEIAARMAVDGHSVAIADLIDWRRDQRIKFVSVRNNRIGLLDASYDTVIALHVFHHSNDPEGLLREAFRVARRRVVFIESVTDSMEEYLYTAWFDWFYNRVVHFSQKPEGKIPVPCRFLPTIGWEQMVWRLYGLFPTVSENLGYYQILNPLHHHLYVYDKK